MLVVSGRCKNTTADAGAQIVSLRRSYLSEECSVELDDVGTVTAPHHHVQVHQQLLLLLLIHRRPDPLRNKHKRLVRTREL